MFSKIKNIWLKIINKFFPKGSKSRAFINKVYYKIYSLLYGKVYSMNKHYNSWIRNNEPTKSDLEKQRNYKFNISPKISIIVPLYNTPIKFFKELLYSIESQTYQNWELCLADGSPKKLVDIENMCSKDSRIKYHFIGENKGISGNTNEALKLATGDFISLLDHDDTLALFALYEIVKCINENPNVEFLYSDEDKLSSIDGTRYDPYFKPDFSIDTLRSNNYICHYSIFKKELMDKLEGFRSKYDGAQDYDIIIRAIENTQNIIHIPKILYHWRIHPNSTAMDSDAKPYAYEAGKRVIEDHLKRQGLEAKVMHGGDIKGIYEVEYKIIGHPKVSIIIPNKDNINILKNCINSILKLTTYDNYEIVIVENNSTEDRTFEYYEAVEKLEKIRIIKYTEKGFNYSKIINFGVKNCDSEFVVQLNSDTELITPNWLEKFIGFAQREDVGAVGGRLYYEDKSIQHAGIVIGIGNLAANMLTGLPQGMHAYFGKDCLIQNMSAVTGACLFSKRSIYEQVGYMDEENFAVALNDVDFCLKIREKGYLVIYNPYVEFLHYESKTRGYEDTLEKQERFNKECERFRTKWKKVLGKGDPYYNINLSRDTAQYDIRTDKIVYKDESK